MNRNEKSIFWTIVVGLILMVIVALLGISRSHGQGLSAKDISGIQAATVVTITNLTVSGDLKNLTGDTNVWGAIAGKQASGTYATVSGNTVTVGTGTLTFGVSKTPVINNSITFSGTDSTTMTFPSTSATIARTDAANTFTGHQTIEGVTSTGATGTGKFVFDTDPTISITAGKVFLSNGSITGNYLQPGATAQFVNNSTTQGGWNSGGFTFRRLRMDYANEDVGLQRVAAKVMSIDDGSTVNTGWMQWAGQKRVSTAYTNATATLGNITGLSVTVQAGRTYTFWAQLDCTLDPTGGAQYAVAGTATASAINYRVRRLGASLAVISSTRQTALASAVNSTAALTDDDVQIDGLITVGNAGTLTIQAAEQSATGQLVVLVGSSFTVFDCP